MSGGLSYTLYRTFASAAGPWLRGYLKRRADQGKEDPARVGERFGRTTLARPQGKLIWLHAASVGESMSALPLLRAILDANPEAHAVFTSGTVTSAALLAERLPKRAFHQFMPLDQPASVQRFLRHWRPDVALWVESEFWPNTLEELRKARIPAALVNARLSDKSFAQWKRAPGLARRMLDAFDLALAQTDEIGARLQALGLRHVEMTGNLKAAAAPLPAAPDALATLRDMIGTRPVFAAASTHGAEEEIIGRAFAELRAERPDLLLILAPRHPDRGPEIAETLRGLGLAVSRRGAKVRIVPETHVYLMDTIGELGLLYRTAPFAFVGGSLVAHGGQNPLEPARLGVAPIHGPHVFNFTAEYDEMDKAGASFAVESGEKLAELAGQWLSDPALPRAAGQRAKTIAERGAGALDAAKAALGPILKKAGFHAPA
ncbi:3-deoxy-D-manno-octulosonic acid transferase [Alphaproteobacteria bacterium SO-S41]|nr:3-deoxy-D-manno-octulosonic acid transferase [Alphaproteobacteria bacterium SO-S41]